MTKVISFANQKGGVGKSTLCIQTAFYMAKEGKKVLVIDMDGQGNTSGRLAPKIVTDDNIIEESFDETATRTYELFQKDIAGGVKPMFCRENIDMIYALTNDVELYSKENYVSEEGELPAKHIRKIRDNYDYVLIDCSPTLGQKLIATILMSTHVVIPIKLSGFALDGVTGLFNTIYSINNIKEQTGERTEIVGLIVNDMDKSVTHIKAYEELKAAAGDLVFKNKIMHRTPLDTASNDGIPVWDINYGHVAAKETIAVIKELIKKVTK